MNFGPIDLNAIGNAVTNTYNDVADDVSDGLQNAADGLQNAADELQDAADGLQDTAEAAWDTTKQTAGAAADMAKDGLVLTGQAAQATWDTTKQTAGAAADMAKDGMILTGQAAIATKDFAIGTGTAIVGFGSWVVGTIGTLAVDQATMGPELISLRERSIAANQGAPAQRRHDTPEEAQEYLDLSMAVYGSGDPIPEGYEEVENAEEELGISLTDPETGLEAKVYKKGDTYVLVFQGSSFKDEAADWTVNLSQGGGAIPEQYRQALDIGLRFQEVYGERGDTVVTGHSLGGGLATFAGVGAGIETYTYNTSGLGPGATAFLASADLIDRNEHLVKNFVQRGDAANLARTILDAAANALFHGLPALFGSSAMKLIGETETVGDMNWHPIEAHNNPDLSTVR